MLIQYSNPPPKQPLARGFGLIGFTKWIPIFIAVTCIICYVVALEKGEIKPFPHCTITQAGEKYPQNILFRYVMSLSGVVINLIWVTLYFTLNFYCKKYLISPLGAEYILYSSIIANIFYQLAVNTIDGGKMAGTLHSVSAVIFFIVFLTDMVVATYVITEVSKVNPKIYTPSSVQAKQLLTFVMVAVWAYEIYQLIKPKPPPPNGDDTEVSIVEWSSMYLLCGYLYTFTWDWGLFYYYIFIPPLNTNSSNEPDNIVNAETVLQIPLFGRNAPIFNPQSLLQQQQSPSQQQIINNSNQIQLQGMYCPSYPSVQLPSYQLNQHQILAKQQQQQQQNNNLYQLKQQQQKTECSTEMSNLSLQSSLYQGNNVW